MTNETFNQILQQALAPIAPDKEINQNLKNKMEGKKMKQFSVKKTVVLAAACCLMFGAVGVASTGVISSISSYRTPKEYTEFTDLAKAEEKAGYQVKAIEAFQNGYHFTELSVSHYTEWDDNDNAVAQYKGIDFCYEKEGEGRLHVNTEESVHSHENTEKAAAAVTEIDGIQVSYYADTYKWVPVGYKLTAEDELNLKRSDYYISEGADEVSENQVTCAVWIQDGVRYSISNVYGVAPPETLFEMAEELITLE